MTGSFSPPPIVVIAGPTASGKSALALALAKELGGEIVSADALQVYRGLDIGTAKPTREERARVPHHVIDVAEPTEAYSAGRFRADADQAIREIRARGRPVLVCGGTALYLKALLGGLAPAPPRDAALRSRLLAAWEAGEQAGLFAELQAADPVLAARLHPNDKSRILRGLEVWRIGGVPLSALQAGHGFSGQPYAALRLGIDVPRDELYRRIDRRVLAMLEAGWADEVRGLLEAGLPLGAPGLQAIGYRELARWVREGGEWGSVVASIQQSTRRFAKRQLTWFRRMELQWVQAADWRAILDQVRKFLQTNGAPL
ncbi:MAG: tRNA (adenosine(37)-N6)-dimethylallyltransferase MiaA [Thermodesulfobacteriota bacterium]